MAKSASRSPDIPLGRHTDATMGVWGEIRRAVPVMPRLFRGDRPRQSPNLEKFVYGYPSGAPDNEQIDEYYQVRGFCVGWGTAHLGENEDGTPETITDKSKWVRGCRFSPGYSYALAREQARKEGVNLGSGDGAIVSHAVMAASVSGFLPWSEWPSDQKSESKQNNSRFPTATQKAAGAAHAVGTYALHDSADSILGTLGSGRLVVVGTDWLAGMADTDSEGRASVSGGSLGGHCYLLVGYDEDKDILLIQNSHPQYGIRDASNRRFAGSGGWTNIAVFPLKSYFSKLFNSSYIRSGRSEALSVAGRAGFTPRVKFPE